METRAFSDLLSPDLVSAWSRLEAAGACPSLFASSAWVRLWSGRFARESTPEVLVGYEGSDPVGLAPLFVSDRGTVEFPVNFLSHRGEFLLAGGTDHSFAAGVLRHFRKQGRRLGLKSVPIASRTYDALAANCRAAGYRLHPRPSRVSPYLDIETPWDEYLASRPSKRTSRWAKQDRKLRDLGRVSIETAEAAGDADRLVDLFTDVEARSWKERRGTSIRGRGLEEFYRDLCRALGQEGWLRAVWLELDRRPIAFILGVAFGGVLYMLKTAYDESHARFSPGMVLVQHVIANAFEIGFSRVDFLGESARWKTEWATGEREHATVTLYPANAMGSVGYLVDAVVKPAASRLRRNR
jgi:CelD/BcsL family acetyltransferase involved in cellulose biosynthesis